MDSPRKRRIHHNGGRPHLGDRVTSSVRLPWAIREQLNDEADARDITLTDLINEFVGRHVDQHSTAAPAVAPELDLGERVSTTVRLPRDLRAQLNDEADARGITFTELVNELIAGQLDRVLVSSSSAGFELARDGTGVSSVRRESLVA